MILFKEGSIVSSDNLHMMAYILSSFKVLNYRFVRSSSGSVFSEDLAQDLRSYYNEGKIKIEHNEQGIRVYSWVGKMENYSDEELWLIKKISSLRDAPKELRQMFYYNFLKFKELEIGDTVLTDSKATGFFLLTFKNSI
jgi:hypothetical protein